MTILVVGATGATGQCLVAQLLERGHHVKAIVRAPHKLPDVLRQNDRLTVIEATVLDLSDAEMKEHVQGCDAVASCLGHTLSFKGLFGPPYRLVTEATRRLCEAIRATQPAAPVKMVLMNTTGNRNRDLPEPRAFAEQIVIGLLRMLLPPHADNEQAADYLRTRVGQEDAAIHWSVVRPDTLLDEEAVTAYEIHRSPVRSAIFDPGQTSRINVGHFMAQLIDDDATWSKWKGEMPVIYNKADA